MHHWIFVIRDDEFIFNKRIQHKKWPLYPFTKFRTYLEVGDKIVFYQAGKRGQKFLGCGVIESESKPIPDKIDYFVEMGEIEIWKKTPSIRDLIPHLGFIKNKEHWGLYLQGGILKIEKKDYSIILKESEKLKKSKTSVT